MRISIAADKFYLYGITDPVATEWPAVTHTRLTVDETESLTPYDPSHYPFGAIRTDRALDPHQIGYYGYHDLNAPPENVVWNDFLKFAHDCKINQKIDATQFYKRFISTNHPDARFNPIYRFFPMDSHYFERLLRKFEVKWPQVYEALR